MKKKLSIILVISLCLIFFAFVEIKISSWNRQKESEKIMNDYGLKLTDTTIYIPGIKKNYSFIYLSDLHIVAEKKDFAIPEWGATAFTRRAWASNGLGLSSAKQLEGWVKLANEKKVDGFLTGGDEIDYLSKDNTDYMKKSLSKLEMPWVFTLGNHDAYKTSGGATPEFVPNDKMIKKLCIKNNPDCQVMNYDDFYIVSIGVNSAGVPTSVTKDALAQLKNLYSKKKPIILIFHVPFETKNTKGLFDKTLEVWSAPQLIGNETGHTYDKTTQQFYKLVL
jgi:hypothetical protein